MQAAIATLIGVLGTGLITVLLQFMRTMNSRFDRLESKVDNLTGEVHAMDTRLTGEIHALDTKSTGEIQALETKLSGEIHALETKLSGELKALGTKFTGELKAHGERLARIEARLNIEPPAEAA